MSAEHVMQALNLQMPPKVPRTEYSVTGHWALLKVVTGIDTSIEANRPAAQREFMKRWNIGFNWSTFIGGSYLTEKGGRVSSMGHAISTAEGKEFNDKVFCGFSDVEEALSLDPVKEYGEFDQADLINRFETAYQAKQRAFPDQVNMCGVYITLFSGLIEIYGWDMLLMAMATDPKRFEKVVAGYVEWVSQFYKAYAKASLPVMMMHDDMCWTSGAVTHPDWYRKQLFPNYRKLIQPVLDAGKKVFFTSDGTIDEFFADIVDLGVHNVVMEPTCDMALFARNHGQRCGFTGGVDTRVLLSGSRDEITAAVTRAMEIGKPCPGYILATGNHIPDNTPVESCLWYDEVYQKLAVR